MKKFYCVLIITFSLLTVSAQTKKSAHSLYTDPAKITIKNGVIEGEDLGNGIYAFKGIPFAAPPVGNLRWREPQPVQNWKGIRSCKAFGPSPMQTNPVPFSMWTKEFLIPKTPISEDCLYLNVWTGAKSVTEKRPVLVWIYGGGFTSGGSAVPIYDGTAMAQKGVVFVSINYRVGIFGFFAHPDLTKESVHHASGNYGLMDQVAALKWVKNNIAAFGGDPQNVTIAGQSAGSMSVNCLVASPLANGLFHRAIAESGASMVRSNPTLQVAEQNGLKLAQSLNASSVNDLRKLPAEQLVNHQQDLHMPVIDGYVLPDALYKIYSEGKENKIALLTGWNEDEGLLFGPVKKAVDFQKEAFKEYGADTEKFLQYFPAATDSEAAIAQLKLSRDMIFGVQNYTWANTESRQGRKVYVYRFTRKVPATGEYVKYGAFHTGEVPYAYDNLRFVDRPWQPVDERLAHDMSAYWVNFITTGDPNGSNLPEWPVYILSEKKILLLGDSIQAVQMKDDKALDFIYEHIKEK